MNSNFYHAEKESNIRELNIINRMIVDNFFSQETKNAVTKNVDAAAKATISNIKEVLSFPIEIDYDPMDPINDNLSKEKKNLGKDNLGSITYEVSEIASAIIAKNSQQLTYIINPMDLKKYTPSEEFKKNNELVISSLKAIIEAVNTQPEPAVVKEEKIEPEEATNEESSEEKKSLTDRIKSIGSKKKK